MSVVLRTEVVSGAGGFCVAYERIRLSERSDEVGSRGGMVSEVQSVALSKR